MKNIFFYLVLFSSLFSYSQTQQNINKNSGTVSNVITTIDSIRFTGSSSIMEVVLQNGTVESHSLSDIVNVNFASTSLHSCGADSVHNQNLIYGNMTDQEGNVYKTIVIGTQEWMAENLKTSIYRNGEPIASYLSDIEWEYTINTQIGAWAYYNNDSLNQCPYGKLYNWYAVVDPRHICPTGWHEPTDGEWTTLTDYLGGEIIAAGKMKSTGLQFWLSPNLDATNESGFSSVPSGIRNYEGTYVNIGVGPYFWSTSEYVTNYAWARTWSYNYGGVSRGTDMVQRGSSVRCLKD